MGKESACNAGDRGSILGSGRSPGERNGNPPQCSCLENSMDRGAWWATVRRVAQNLTCQLNKIRDVHSPWLNQTGTCDSSAEFCPWWLEKCLWWECPNVPAPAAPLASHTFSLLALALRFPLPFLLLSWLPCLCLALQQSKPGYPGGVVGFLVCENTQ